MRKPLNRSALDRLRTARRLIVLLMGLALGLLVVCTGRPIVGLHPSVSEPWNPTTVLFAGISFVLAALFAALRITLKRSERLVDASLLEAIEARSRAELVTRSAPNAIFTFDADYRITSWNASCERITGYTQEEALGRHCSLLGADRCNACPASDPEAPPAPEIAATCTITRQDGTIRTILRSTRTIRDEAERVVGGIVSFEDITERTRLKLEARHLALLLESTMIEIIIFSARDFGLIQVNRGARQNLGFIDDAWRDLAFHDLVPEFTSAEFAERICDEHGPRRQTFIRTKVQRRDGSSYDADIHIHTPAEGGDTCTAIIQDISHRARAERELRTSRERLELALNGADLGLWDWNVQTSAVTYNARWGEMLGYRPEELDDTLETWSKLVHPDDYDEVVAVLQEHLEGRSDTYETEHRMRHKSGIWIWVLDRGRVIERDEEGHPLRACGTHLDITRRKQMEMERELLLQGTEENMKVLSGLIEAAEIATGSADLDTLLWRTCRHIPQAWSYPRITRCRIRLDDAIYDSQPFDPTAWHQITEIVVNGTPRGTVEVYYTIAKPELDEGPFCNEERELLNGITSMLTGAIERHLSERALKAQSAALENERANLQAMFDAAQVGMLLVDEDFEIVKVNEVLAKALGSVEMSLLNKLFGNVLGCVNAANMAGGCGASPACGDCRIRRSINAVLGTRREIRNVESRHELLVQGIPRTFHLSLSASPLTMAGREHVLLSLFDITGIKTLEHKLAQAQKLESVGQLAAGIAHEINTPTQFVSDSVHFLKEAFDDQKALLDAYRELLRHPPDASELEAALIAADEEADLGYLLENVPESIDRSLEGLERISRIVGAMKEFSHPGRTHQSQSDLNQALDATLTIAHNEYKYVADVETDFGPLPPVTCHVNDLNQVFLNLLVNAAHAIADVVGESGAMGRITVRTRSENGMAVVEIADTGCGIPEEHRNRVYDPFFTTKDVGKGSGQGLAIAHAIVTEKHGGTLDFESVEGEGTTFRIRIPVDGLDAAGLAGEEVDAHAEPALR